jgi:hypothetical protein
MFTRYSPSPLSRHMAKSTPRSQREWSHFMQSISFILTSIVVLSACDRIVNIGPGDADYPVLKSNPSQVIKVTVTAPPSIGAHIVVGYTARSIGGGHPCAYTGSLMGPTHQYSVAVPVNLKQVNNTYIGEVAIDRFESGECGWDFATAWYVVDQEGPDRSELFALDRFASNYPENSREDIWCIKSEKRSRELPMACLPAIALHGQFPELVPQSTFETISKSGIAAGPPLQVGSNTRSINVVFHDMDWANSDPTLHLE